MVIPDLDTPIVRVGTSEYLRVRDLVAGLHATGSPSSGKTSGTLALVMQAMMANAFGGLCLCVKPNERERIEGYARATGREDSLVIFSPRVDERHNRHWRFNVLDYAYRRQGYGAGLTETIVELITIITHIVEGKQSLSSSEPHWERAAKELVRNALGILVLTDSKLSLDALYQLVIDAPEGEQVEDDLWKKRSFLWNLLRVAEGNVKTPADAHNLRMAKRYWLKTYAGLADRTRSSILSTFSAMADVMLHEPLNSLLNSETNFVPEISYRDGAIIVADMPLREYAKTGLIAQSILRYMWEQSILRRDVSQYPRPVMLVTDEGQHFFSETTYQFQAECREVRCATLAATQNINNYYAVAKDHDEVHAWLGNFNTHVLHSNNDVATNSWASEAIGYAHTYRKSWGTGSNEMGSYFNFGGAEQREYKVEPAAFTMLRKASAENDWTTEVILFQGGRQWEATGDTWLKAKIRQDNAPALPSVVVPHALAKEEQLAWFIRFMEWLLIFLHRHNAMDVLEAMHWQEDMEGALPQRSLGDAVSVIGVRGEFEVPVLDIEGAVDWVFQMNSNQGSLSSEGTN